MVMDRLRGCLLRCISFPALSRLYGRLTRIRHPRRLARWMIRTFQRSHRIDMSRFQGDPDGYSSLAEFFVRPLETAALPPPAARTVISPADGRLVGMETVDADAATQVKGLPYSLSELVGERIDFSTGWHVATVYLSPADYHRFHHPLDCRVTGTRRLGGRRFPVNAMGSRLVPRLFVRNERVVVRYVHGETRFFLAAVGATFVGGIHMTLPMPAAGHREWLDQDTPIRQLDELGRFDLGSTIILLIPASLAVPQDLQPGTRVLVGTPLFRLSEKSKV